MSTRALLIAASMLASTVAFAQTAPKTTDVVVMRVGVAKANPKPTPTPTPVIGIVNGGFNPNGGGWTNESGFSYRTINGETVGNLDSPTVNTPGIVTQPFDVTKGRAYTFSYKTSLQNGSYCSAPFVAYFADGNTVLAQDSFDNCGTYNRSFTWTADRTKTIKIGFRSQAQGSNRTFPAIYNAAIVSK